jgi:peptide methionine sulfoxide reductase MsrB
MSAEVILIDDHSSTSQDGIGTNAINSDDPTSLLSSKAILERQQGKLKHDKIGDDTSFSITSPLNKNEEGPLDVSDVGIGRVTSFRPTENHASRTRQQNNPLTAIVFHGPSTTTKPRRGTKKIPELSLSMHTTRTPRRHDIGPRSNSFTAGRRRIHEVDGMPLKHWDRNNFESKRDETCRVVYKPKDGKDFFCKNLPMEDYEVMKTISLEQPYYSKYNRFFPKQGHFCCKACGNTLYSYLTKFDAEDGWPAFGGCVEGAIGVISSAKRQAQIKREHDACIKMQAFIRGALCRIRVTRMLEDLIQQMLAQKQSKQNGKADDDSTTNKTINFTVRSPLLSPNMVKKKLNRTKVLRYTLLTALGGDYTEIHCHRCKSHLGDVLAEANVGRNGREFHERHRVNGRALKYVEEDLPKRIMVESSLLFADRARRRLLGLPSPKKTCESARPLRITPFISPREQRRRLRSIDGIASDPLSVSCHSTVQRNATSRRKMKGLDALSVTIHGPARVCRAVEVLRTKDDTTTLGKQVMDNHDTLTWTTPGRRKTNTKFRATNLQEKRAALEQFILSKSMH